MCLRGWEWGWREGKGEGVQDQLEKLGRDLVELVTKKEEHSSEASEVVVDFVRMLLLFRETKNMRAQSRWFECGVHDAVGSCENVDWNPLHWDVVDRTRWPAGSGPYE